MAETALPNGKAAAAPAGVNGEGLPTLMTADVCVVGGGAAGTAAAISAARTGAKVVLVERGISLGGLATQGCVFPCMPTYAFDSDTPYIMLFTTTVSPSAKSESISFSCGLFFVAPVILSM